MKKIILSLALLTAPCVYGMEAKMAASAPTKTPSILTPVLACYDELEKHAKTFDGILLKKIILQQVSRRRSHFESYAKFVAGEPDTHGYYTCAYAEETTHLTGCEYKAFLNLLTSRRRLLRTRYPITSIENLEKILKATQKQEIALSKALQDAAYERGFKPVPCAQPTFEDLETWHAPASDLETPEDCHLGDLSAGDDSKEEA